MRSHVASASSRMQRRGRDRPPGLPPRPARSSIARRTTQRSVRAAARRRGACPRARCRARRSRRSAQPSRNTPKARHRCSSCSRARRASSKAFGAARAGRHASIRKGRVHSSKCERADMGEVRHPRLHAINERNRAIDVAERPERNRQIDHRGDAGVLVRSERPDRRRGRAGTGRAPFRDDPAPRDIRRRTNK